MAELKDDKEIDELMEDLELKQKSEIEKKIDAEIKRVKGLLAIPSSWPFLSCVCVKIPGSFKGGVYFIHDQSPIGFLKNPLIPWPEHYIDLESMKVMIEKSLQVTMTLMSSYPFFAPFFVFTPNTLLMLTGQRSEFKMVKLRHDEQDLLETFEEKMEAFNGTKAEFAKTSEGAEIIEQYLMYRDQRRQEHMVSAQYTTQYHPVITSTFDIILYYSRMRDIMEQFDGFTNEADIHGRTLWNIRRDAGNKVFRSQLQKIEDELFIKFPSLINVMDELERQVARYGDVVDWTTSALVEFMKSNEILAIVRFYTIGIIDAFEWCILTMMGVNDIFIPCFLCSKQPAFTGKIGDMEADMVREQEQLIKKSITIMYKTRFSILAATWRRIPGGKLGMIPMNHAGLMISSQQSMLLAYQLQHMPSLVKNRLGATKQQVIMGRVPVADLKRDNAPLNIMVRDEETGEFKPISIFDF